MKKLFSGFVLMLVLVLIPSLVCAAPFLVCDPYPYLPNDAVPSEFEVVMDGGPIIISLPETIAGGKRIHYDLAGVSSGSHTVSVKACLTDPSWGRYCSDAAVFTFVRPATLGKPVNVKISP